MTRITQMISTLLFMVGVILLITGCGDDETDDSDKWEINVTVAGGTTPTISWTLNNDLNDVAEATKGKANRVYVGVEGQSDWIWLIKSGDENGISSPAIYGETPSGATEEVQAQALQSGVKHDICVDVLVDYEGYANHVDCVDHTP